MTNKTNELLNERREFQKKRYKWSIIQLSAILFMTLYNCISELLFPTFVLPISFYLPQFIITYSQATVKSAAFFVLFTVLSFLIIAFIGVCLALSRKFYSMISFITAIVYVDFILLIYIGLQSILIKGFEPFFIVNLFLHVWILILTSRLRSSAEALEVLPERIAEDDEYSSETKS